MGTKLVDWLSMSYWPCSVGFCFVHFGVSVQITDSNCLTGIQNGMENCAYHDTSLSDIITDKIGIHPPFVMRSTMPKTHGNDQNHESSINSAINLSTMTFHRVSQKLESSISCKFGFAGLPINPLHPMRM